jgi:hypothetical protein
LYSLWWINPTPKTENNDTLLFFFSRFSKKRERNITRERTTTRRTTFKQEGTINTAIILIHVVTA